MVRSKKTGSPLADRLKQTALDAKLPPEAIAARLNKSISTIKHWQSGRNEPSSYADLEAYAAVVGRSVYYLVSGQEDPAALYDAIQGTLAEFKRRLEAGDSAEAAAAAVGAEVTAENRAALSGATAPLRDYLAADAGEAWVRLTEEDRQLVLQLVWQLARRH